MLRRQHATRRAARVADNARDRRRRRAAILAQRRAAGQNRSSLRREQNEPQNNSIDIDLTSDSDSETDVVVQTNLQRASNNASSSEADIVAEHFHRMRNRPMRRPLNYNLNTDEADDDDSDGERLGVQDINSICVDYPLQPYQLQFPYLMDESNYVCPHCNSVLWKEERSSRYNCCNKGRSAIHPLKIVPESVNSIFRSASFRKAQRRYNGLFSFTALGAGGMEKRTWTEPGPPSMLCLHGKAYHRIFDLQEYEDYNVINSARFYIYDSEFAEQASSSRLNLQIASALRTHIHTNIRWARDYKSAVDSILNQSHDSRDHSESSFIQFAEVSRTNDGPILGDNPTAPEIAALVYSSGQQSEASRTVVTYPKHSPDNKPRFLPLWSSSYETLQFPLLFLHGEAGWSKGHYSEDPPFKSKTMNKQNTHAVTFPFYCRQIILSEPIFKLNSRIAQEWVCDSLSRMEEERLNFVENGPLQRRLASDRSIRDSVPSEQPGKLLPASHPGSPAKRKSDTEDALSIVNRRGRPHLFITVTFNADWPEVKENLLPGQNAYDRPDLCCRVFKQKMKEIMKVRENLRTVRQSPQRLRVPEKGVSACSLFDEVQKRRSRRSKRNRQVGLG